MRISQRLGSKTTYVLNGKGVFDSEPDEYSEVKTSLDLFSVRPGNEQSLRCSTSFRRRKAFISLIPGATAINLFFRNLPRLSVDIDLTYLTVQNRKRSMSGINAAMDRIAERGGTGDNGRTDFHFGTSDHAMYEKNATIHHAVTVKAL